jgi:ketosteroid isomerase-like protein
MDRERIDAWIEGYRRAWEGADTPAVRGLFTTDATYRSHPLRPAHTGHDGVAAYWDQACAGQADVRARFGDPIVDGDRVAVEWWTTMRSDGDPVSLVGCLLLSFAGDGRCQALRECWNLTEQLQDPPADWGHLRPGDGRDGPDPAADAPPAGDPAREHARRWAEGYEAAWRAGDPEAAAALYAPNTHYRSEAFRAPHLGREGVLAYTRQAYASEGGQDPRFGTPFAASRRRLGRAAPAADSRHGWQGSVPAPADGPGSTRGPADRGAHSRTAAPGPSVPVPSPSAGPNSGQFGRSGCFTHVRKLARDQDRADALSTAPRRRAQVPRNSTSCWLSWSGAWTGTQWSIPCRRS